jgi:regulator of nonsense transcripts 1
MACWSARSNEPFSAGYAPDYPEADWDSEDGQPDGHPPPRPADVPAPAPHCEYCLCDILECLVSCKNTKRYFCNGRGKGRHSHILHHLVKSHNKEIVLPDSNPFSRIPLVCYVCRTNNVFQLGFVQSLRQGTFFVICRDCMNDGSLAPYEFDINGRQALITDNSILSWIVRPPTADEEKQFLFQIKNEDMDLLEECWARGDDVTIRDIPQIKAKNQLPQTQLRYSGVREYCRIFKRLIQEERDFEKQSKESMMIRNVQIAFEPITKRSWLAKFIAPANESLRRLSIGDDMKLDAGDGFSYEGTVVGIGYNDVVEVKLSPVDQSSPPLDPGLRFTIQFVFNEGPYKRLLSALKDFERRKTDDLITSIVLGTVPDEMPRQPVRMDDPFTIPRFPPLNQSQVAAVRAAMEQPFTLIQGPPGTGKTTTIAAFVHEILTAGRGPVLVCGPSNVTVEHVTRYIAQTDCNVVRLVAWSLDGVPSSVDDLTVSRLIYKLESQEVTQLRVLEAKRQSDGLSQLEQQEYEQRREHLERRICEKADVVCCTTDTAGSQVLTRSPFPVVVIDESTQTIEPKLLIPILHQSKQVVLVGDHCQLGPVVMSPKAKQAGFAVSLFQRLVQLGMRPYRLQTQYRMHPALSEFPSNYFYEGTLLNGVSVCERTPARAVLPFPQPSIPMFFYNSPGEEEPSDSGTSFINRYEAFMVSQIITKLCRAQVNPRQIGVITPYAGQRFYLKQFLAAAGGLPLDFYPHIEIASVDSFQGGERDYIILSCVRANRHSAIGFLKDPRRLNVAITRARMGLVIIGSAKVLAVNKLWYALIKHFQSKELLVEGMDLSHLKPSPMVLGPPLRGQPGDRIRGVPVAATGEGMVPDLEADGPDEYCDQAEDGYFVG